jgi:hypothetical protein
MVDYNKTLGMLVAPFGYDRSALSCLDSVVDTATFTGRAAFNVARDLQDIEDHNNKLRMLAAPFAYERSGLSGVDSIDISALAGSAAFEIAYDVHQNEPIVLYDGFGKDFVLRPVFTIEYKAAHDAPKTYRPLIKKKNCSEEEYSPNQGEIQTRIFLAFDTFFNTQEDRLQKVKERLRICENNESRKRQEQRARKIEMSFEEELKIEGHEYLLLPENELKQRLIENPTILSYLIEGLQKIMSSNNQLRNDPDFIEEQRRKVAYNLNSYYLDDGTDHLLNYEAMRWLNRVRSEGIACNHEPEKKENNAHETALHKIEATSEIKFHERDISAMHLKTNLDAEKEVYRIAREHKPRETWPDCVFDELFEIQKRTGETNLKVSERFCEIAGIIEQARALKKAWIDHNSSKNKKGTIQAQSRHDSDTIQTRNHI